MDSDRKLHQYLPEIIQQSSPFLRELLAIFAAHFGEIDELLSTTALRVDPAKAGKELLPWLASWVDLEIEEDWSEAKKRRVIGKVFELYRRRGTPGGLSEYLKTYTGLDATIGAGHEHGVFQIGVASRIGGWRSTPPTDTEYYLVYRHAAPTMIYSAAKVKEVKVEPGGSGGAHGGLMLTIQEVDNDQSCSYADAHIVRRGSLSSPHILRTRTKSRTENEYFDGDTIVTDELDAPHSISVHLTGPALAGVVDYLTTERRMLTEALFARQQAESHFREVILSYLTGDASSFILDVVESDSINQALGHYFEVPPVEAGQAERDLVSALEASILDRANRAMPGFFPLEGNDRLAQRMASEYVQGLKTFWPLFGEDEDERARVGHVIQGPLHDQICQIQLAEVALRTFAELGMAGLTEVERYISPNGQTVEEPEAMRRVQALLDREKPVHVRYELSVIQKDPPAPPTMRIGVVSRIGASSVIS